MALDLAFVLAFAFGAGMVAFFSPCCVAMLPAYVSFALGKAQAGKVETKSEAGQPAARRRTEAAGLLVWGGLFVAALGLGRLAIEALGSFGAPTQALSPEDRAVAVGMASAGIALTILGYALSAQRALLRRAVTFGGLATVGFLVVFIVIGIPIALAAGEMLSVLLYAAIAVGVGLIALGVATLTGVHLTLPIRSFSPEAKGLSGFFLFGAAYGVASLACTFPIFLVVVSLAMVAGGFAAALAAFAAYALGKGAIMILVTVLATASPAAVEGRLKQWLPKFDKAMAVVLIASGAFIVYYFALR